MSNKLIVLLVLACTYSFLKAQSDSMTVSNDSDEIYGPFDMEEIVVTATRYKQKIANVTSAVSVIDSKEIESSNAVYVMDVIKRSGLGIISRAIRPRVAFTFAQ